ncbi:hypothetical protein WAI453_011646 [Rhynchosporium graminicola]|uniref:Related to A.thaliana hyp1 protein n=1 Tax=Rhynchosporium graminicola TaxID=2792576 RepID=A0A1E1LTI0_9HELO|nr:related to A.thaliana hyp1 protein [Rhynchosporium commune]
MTAEHVVGGVVRILQRELGLNVTDTRQGSGRDGANSTSGKKFVEPTNTASIAALFATLIPVLVYAVICLSIFVVGRKFFPRVYYPRTFLSSIAPHERSKPLPEGWFNWIVPFWTTPDIEILNHASLDGFLFLRYIKMLVIICLVGCCCTFPVLVPIHIYGGGGSKELDMLTFGNVKDVKWLWAHAMLAWVYFGFILYLVARESVYFINIRQAYLLSPHYANRLSSRTVLFTCVPNQILDERKIRRIFGDSVKNVWIPRETDDLDDLVKEREQTSDRLERAEIQLIKKATIAYKQAVKNGHPSIDFRSQTPSPRDSAEKTESKSVDVTVRSASPTTTSQHQDAITSPRSTTAFATKSNCTIYEPPPDINGSVAAQWIPASQRPTHRPIANYGRSVDTIKWTRNQLKKMAPEISKLRRDYRKGKPRPIPAAFVEFQTQSDAQMAYQTLAHHRANHMKAEIVGIVPEEIVWNSMYFPWWQRIIRRFLIQAVVVFMVIFWALPAAAVGVISNITYLTKTIPFLGFINSLPSVILGLITGLLPAVALATLMAIVPMIMRACARQAGVATQSRIELFVQNSYFLFQVIQVFLITTFSSSISSAAQALIKNPMGIRDLLSSALPKASNFYISYFILQGLALSASRIVHLGGLVRHQLLRWAGGRPRIISRRYHRLRKIHWGSIFPMFTNMGVIAISYSLIAPLILGVAALCLSLVYLTYKYNLLYVYSSSPDSRGIFYPRALKQTLTGVYIAEICMIGLFGLKGAYGPLVMTFGLVIFTTLIHVSLNQALSPLLFNLPRTLAIEEELRRAGNPPFLAANLMDMNEGDLTNTAAGNLDDGELNIGYDSDFDPSTNSPDVDHGMQNSRSLAPEGTDRIVKMSVQTIRKYLSKQYASSPLPSLLSSLDFWSYWITPSLIQNPNFILKFLHPEVFADYHVLRDMIPDEVRDVDVTSAYEESVLRDAYSPPSMRSRAPRLWIPRDGLGVSAQEVRHCAAVGVEISDAEAWVNERGQTRVDLEGEVENWVTPRWERVRF